MASPLTDIAGPTTGFISQDVTGKFRSVYF